MDEKSSESNGIGILKDPNYYNEGYKSNTANFPIKHNYYYIIDFSDLFNPRLYPVYFVNKEAGKRALEVNIKNLQKRKRHSVVLGKWIKDERLRYILKLGSLSKFTKYQYPEDRLTKQQKKTYRTVMRRRLRRMGLLTLIKPKKSIKDSVTQVRHVKNNQKVAKSPSTIARAFKLERKPHYLYLILKKRFTSKKGKLFHIRTIRIDLRNFAYKKVWIYTMRNDVIQPYLLTEVLKMIPNEKELNELIRRVYTRFLKGGQEATWQVIPGDDE